MNCLRLTTLFALPLAIALSFGAAPGPAAAQTADDVKCTGCVGTGDIKDRGVFRRDIRANAITGGKVKNDSLTASDLQDEGGVDYIGEGANPNLASTPDTILSITISAPAAGHVIVNTSGYFFYDTNGGGATCSITTDTVVDRAFEIRTEVVGASTDTEFTPFAGTRGFAVLAGSTTFNLVCVEDIPNVAVRDAVLTAIYAPTRY